MHKRYFTTENARENALKGAAKYKNDPELMARRSAAIAAANKRRWNKWKLENQYVKVPLKAAIEAGLVSVDTTSIDK